MLISSISNCNLSFNNLRYTPQKTVSFGGNISDVFVRNTRKTLKPQELLKKLQGDFMKLDKSFFDKLSDEEYKFCLKWARGDEKIFSGHMPFYSARAVLPEDVSELVKYADFYATGLQRIAKKSGKSLKDVIAVGIGQSPVATIKLLDLIGVKTAHCPISGLSSFKEPIEKYVTPENVDKYFSYWKNFGFDIDLLFKDKLIIFTDHKESGNTLKLFEKIIRKIIEIKKSEPKYRNKKIADIRFLSLSDIYKASRKQAIDKQWGDEFEESVFHSSYLKTLYSPLFKLPLPQISEIAKKHKLAKNSDCNVRFNKFTTLLYEELYRRQPETVEKRFSRIKDERAFRLAFYTPPYEE